MNTTGKCLTGTGAPVDLEVLEEVRSAAKDRPVWIGSGLNLDNVERYRAFIDAAIVGTSVKLDGRLSAPVDPERVTRLAAAFRA